MSEAPPQGEDSRATEPDVRRFAAHLPQRVYLKDRALVYLSCNARYAADFGRAPGQIIGCDDFALFPAAAAEAERAEDRAVLESGAACITEEVRAPGGARRLFRVTRAPYEDDRGRIIGVLGILDDVSDARAQEAEPPAGPSGQVLHESSPLLLGLAEWDGCRVIPLDPASPAARFLGVTPEQAAAGPSGQGRLPPDLEQLWGAQFRKCQLSGSPARFEFEFGVAPERRWAEATAAYIGPGAPGRHRFSYVAQDVTARRLATKKRYTSDQRYRMLFHSMSQGVVHQDAQGSVIAANPSALRILGLTMDQILGRTSFDPRWRTVGPDGTVLPGEEHPAMQALRSGQEVRGVVLGVFNPTTERTRWIRVDAVPVRDGDAPANEVFSVFDDITEQRLAEEALAASEARYHSLYASMLEGVALHELLHGPDGRPSDYRILDVNPAYERITGLSRQAVVGRLASEVYGSRTAPYLEIYSEVVATGQPRNFEVTFEPLRKSMQVSAFRPAAGRFATVFADVSERKRAEAELRESKDLMQYLVKNDPNAIAVFDLDMRYIAVSNRFVQDYGVKEEHLLGRTHYEVFPDLPERWREVHQRCLRGAIERCEDDSFERLDGSITYNRWECRPWYRTNGAIGGIVMYTEVTTERKLAEIALRESEERWRSYVENAPYGVFITDDAGRYLQVNPAACRVTGYGEAELLRMTVPDLLAPESLDDTRRHVARLLETGQSHAELGWITRQGARRVWAVAAVRLSPTRFLSFAEDVTERRQAEQSLRRIEWMLRPSGRPAAGPSRHSPAYGDLVQLNTCRVILNAVGAEMLEDIVRDCLDLLETSAAVYEANGDYALGIFSSGWCRFMDEASRRRCGTGDNREALESGRWLCHESCWNGASRLSMDTNGPVDIACAGGIRLYAVPIRAGGRIVGSMNFGYGDPPLDPVRLQELAALYGVRAEDLAEAAQAYETRPPFVVEIAKRRLEASARLLGEIVERKRAEQEQVRLRSQLDQAQRMESIGRLAGGVAHDFNNMLQIILGHSSLVLDGLQPEGRLRNSIEEIRRAGERSAELTRQLLAFARRQAIQPRPLNLNEVIGSTLTMLRRLVRENIELNWSPGTSLWPVLADPSQLDQILANLVANARDAIGDVGTVTIETRNVVLGPSDCEGRPDFVPGDYVRLSVTDDGCGISREAMEHLFEPFFTTKEVGRGTGLGLATVYGVVRQNHGFLQVQSEPGRGTAFWIFLPRLTGPIRTGASDPFAGAIRGGSETVLLVEDERALLVLARDLLQSLGYRVLTAAGAAEAIEVAREHGAGIDLLLTDVVMPRMNGRDLSVRLRSLIPNLKTLFMSGYAAETVVRDGLIQDHAHFLQKPFSIPALAEKVREALES